MRTMWNILGMISITDNFLFHKKEGSRYTISFTGDPSNWRKIIGKHLDDIGIKYRLDYAKWWQTPRKQAIIFQSPEDEAMFLMNFQA